jgi:glucose/arabinose dehydrogenase
MHRALAIIAAAAALAAIALVVLLDAPPAQNAGAAEKARLTAARHAASPPQVALRKLPFSFDQPLYLTSPPGDTSRLFVVEKTGVIRIVKRGKLLAKPFLDISGRVSTGGERGLLSMAFDPAYAKNRRFYIDYTNVIGDTRVVRYRASRSNPDRAVPGSARVLLAVEQPYANHNGGQLQFAPSGKLFVGMGDGGSAGDPQRHAQDPRSRLGKLLRLDVHSRPTKVSVYAKGVRNPWRFSFDRKTGGLWIGDVGQNQWEEIDYLRPGTPANANLGWNGYEGTHVYDAQVAGTLKKSSLTWPVAQYSHALGSAVTGGYVYRGRDISALRGWYLFADFSSGHVWAKKGPGGAKQLLPGADGKVGMIASFGQDARGELYVVSLAGAVYRIVK